MSIAQLKSGERVSTQFTFKHNHAEEPEKVHRVSSLTADQLPNSEPTVGAPVIVTDALRAAYASFFAHGCF